MTNQESEEERVTNQESEEEERVTNQESEEEERVTNQESEERESGETSPFLKVQTKYLGMWARIC